MLGLCSLLALFCGAPQTAPAEPLTGTIRIIDGDTIALSSSPSIRLVGIDTPETDQVCRDASGAPFACGKAATEFARQAYEGRVGRCDVEGRDTNGRLLAVCHVDGQDINAELVRQGVARIYRSGMRYEDPRYLAEQEEAIRLVRGFWSGEMQDPAEWRAERKAGAASPRAKTGTCDIKGNISDNGHLYHLPGSGTYARTRIDTDRGERWFCSEAEAQAAGWSRAGP